MPKIERIGAWLIHFFSLEENRAHVHIEHKDGRHVKIWLEPVVEIARNDGLKQRELKRFVRLVSENKTKYMEAWHGHFSDSG